MVAPRHVLLILGVSMILACMVGPANTVESSDNHEKILSGAVRAKRCSAGCDKPNKAKNKCKAYGGYCSKKKRKCQPGENFNKKWCKGMCGCCYKEFEPLKCGQTNECKTHNGTLQDSRLDCKGGDMINQYSNKNGCTCCVKTVKPLVDYHTDNWSTGSFSGSAGRTFLYTTAPYSWHSCRTWCGEHKADQANVTDVLADDVAQALNANALGQQDWWTSGCGSLNGCTDFRPRYHPFVSCFNLKCSYHQGCLCVQE